MGWRGEGVFRNMGSPPWPPTLYFWVLLPLTLTLPFAWILALDGGYGPLALAPAQGKAAVLGTSMFNAALSETWAVDVTAQDTLVDRELRRVQSHVVSCERHERLSVCSRTAVRAT